MNWSSISDLLISAVRMATPLLFVALAELYSERAGQVNIGLDGIMAFGSLVGFLVCYWTGNPFLGVRGIRLCFLHEDMFRVQIRAILRASRFGPVKLLIPPLVMPPLPS